jgi:hypothetical protein
VAIGVWSGNVLYADASGPGRFISLSQCATSESARSSCDRPESRHSAKSAQTAKSPGTQYAQRPPGATSGEKTAASRKLFARLAEGERIELSDDVAAVKQFSRHPPTLRGAAPGARSSAGWDRNRNVLPRHRLLPQPDGFEGFGVVVAIPFEAFNRQDFEAVLILRHPQGEFRPVLDLVESGIAEPSYYGHAGYMASSPTGSAPGLTSLSSLRS